MYRDLLKSSIVFGYAIHTIEAVCFVLFAENQVFLSDVVHPVWDSILNI